jgi:hypothetical protein
MKSLTAALSVCISLLCGEAAGQAAPAGTPASVKPGLWETTTVVENPATNSRRSVVGRTCITAADAGNPQRIVPPQREPGMQCENQDIKRDGAGWAWNISCKSADGGQKGTGKMSVAAESYVGRAEVEQQKKGAKPVKVGQTFSGKWIQACS